MKIDHNLYEIEAEGRKINENDFVATKGGWEVVTLQIAININGHRGYPRKCPAEQNIQEHIWSRVSSGTEIILQTTLQSIKDLGTNPLCLGNVDQRQPIWPEPCPGQPPWRQPC